MDIFLGLFLLIGGGLGLFSLFGPKQSKQQLLGSAQSEEDGRSDAVLRLKVRIQELDRDLSALEELPAASYLAASTRVKRKLLETLYQLEELEAVLPQRTYEQLFHRINDSYDAIVTREQALSVPASSGDQSDQRKAVLWQLEEELAQLKDLKQEAQTSLEKGETEAYLAGIQSAKRKLEQLRSRVEDKEDYLDDADFDALLAQLFKLEEEIDDTLVRLDLLDGADKSLSQLAPELVEVIEGIQLSHLVIKGKIQQSTAGNKEELLALHETQLRQFEDIYATYLKIKRCPQDYKEAEERLTAAYQALETYNRKLTNTIRQLNEAELHDFEISLRMMEE